MNRTIKTVALFMVLSTMAVGCQKESVEPIRATPVELEMHTLYKVCYTVDGVEHWDVHFSEEEHTAFIYRMLDLAIQGHEVSFYDESKVSQGFAAKDVVTFDTPDKNEAYNWAYNMEQQGYKVSVEFNTTTNSFHCVAIL